MRLSIILLFIPILSFSQKIFDEDSIDLRYIIENCNVESKTKATDLLHKYRKVQMDNQFDFTLKSYFEILQYPNCEKYNDLLEDLWMQNKVISENFLSENYLNNKSNYSKLLTGFNLEQDFRFANNHPSDFTLDQGVNKDLWFEILNYIKNESENDYIFSVQKNIEQLTSHDLLNFISVIKEHFDLNIFENDLINKMQVVEYPFDLDFLISEVINNEKNHPIIEKILNDKKAIWDRGNWSKKYWDLINKYDFKIESDSYYTMNENGEKIYDIEKFISYYTNKGEIGGFPIVSVNFELNNSYSKKYKSLKEFLETLNIQTIEVQKSEDAVKVYGSRGKDGFLKITTK